MTDEAFPDVTVWTFPVRPRKGVEPRTYEQRELSMDGEARLFRLLAQSVERLRKNGFDFNALLALFPDIDRNDPAAALSQYRSLDFGQLAGLLATVADEVPFLLSEGAACLLGIFPTDHLGNRNASYNDDVAFLRQNLHISDVVTLLEVAWGQNDTERLLAPFVRVVKEVMGKYDAATVGAGASAGG